MQRQVKLHGHTYDLKKTRDNASVRGIVKELEIQHGIHLNMHVLAVYCKGKPLRLSDTCPHYIEIGDASVKRPFPVLIFAKRIFALIVIVASLLILYFDYFKHGLGMVTVEGVVVAVLFLIWLVRSFFQKKEGE